MIPRSSSSQALAQPPQGGSAPCDPFAQLLAEHEQQLSIVAQLESLSVTDAPLIKSLPPAGTRLEVELAPMELRTFEVTRA